MMRHIKLVGLCLTITVAFCAVLATGAWAVPQHIYKVEGKKLEAGPPAEKEEIRAKLKPGTEFTIKGKGVLNIEWVVKCTAFKINAGAKPMVVGGTPGTSEKEFFEFDDCKATAGGVACSSFEPLLTSEVNDELVTILAPAASKGKLANWFAPDNEEKKFISFKLNKCGIVGSQKVEITGTTAALVSPEAVEGPAQTWAWNVGSEITEIERQNTEKLKPELTANKNKVTFNGEVEVELVSKKEWGTF